ncbi:MAG TPA: hypothetical protein VMT32_11165 [Bryobacteraceae bacterium]|nr:hypothetical protein [Bryobacteraceae bacterium]
MTKAGMRVFTQVVDAPDTRAGGFLANCPNLFGPQSGWNQGITGWILTLAVRVGSHGALDLTAGIHKEFIVFNATAQAKAVGLILNPHHLHTAL